MLMFCSQKRVILTQSIVESLTQVPPSEESHYWLESAHQTKIMQAENLRKPRHLVVKIKHLSIQQWLPLVLLGALTELVPTY